MFIIYSFNIAEILHVDIYASCMLCFVFSYSFYYFVMFNQTVFLFWHVCILGGGQPRRNSSITCTVIRSGYQAPNSNDDELVTDALMGRSKASGIGGHATSQGATGNNRPFGNDNGTSDLKNELQTGYDVKIGDGMDIGIHGENGKYTAI